MKYTLSYHQPTTQYIPITAEFEVSDDHVILQFPVWRPGRYERADFAKNIYGFKVYGSKGKLPFHKISKDQWSVECSGESNIKVEYKYFAAELNAGSTFMDDLQMYVNPVNCLVYIKEQIQNACTLELNIPEDFDVACGVRFIDNKAEFKDYHQLVDSPFIASATLIHHQFKCRGVHFHVWFQGPDAVSDQYISDFEKYTLSQINKFGAFPVDEYHYLFQIQKVKAYHGVEHQASTVCSLGPEEELFSKLYDDFLGVSSHELYHTWNVKALRPDDWHPYDYSTENYSELGYVAEGVTTYMGDLFLVESGVKNWEWYKGEFEKLLQRHFDNFGRFNYSVAESSFDTWLDGYFAGAPNRKVSIYNEGALLSFMMDAKIRTSSNNKASLHDVMKHLYEEFAVKDKGYTKDDFKKALELFCHEDLTSFFDQYYYGTHSFEAPLTKALEQVGLAIKMDHNTSWVARILGAKVAQSTNRSLIKQISPGSSAELAGLMLEDEILKVNGENVENNINELVEKYKDDQIDLTIKRMGREIERMCPHTNKSFFPLYKIEKLKNPSNLQKRIFKKWCGNDWDQID